MACEVKYMKFLLVAVNAKYIHSNPAVYSLCTYAVAKNPSLKEHIEIAQYTINNRTEDILADIYKRRPDAVGFSCYIWNITCILELSQELHKLLPQTAIWLGGPEVSYNAGELLGNHLFLTGIMIGEGEQTFLELMERYVEAELSQAERRTAPKLSRKTGKAEDETEDGVQKTVKGENNGNPDTPVEIFGDIPGLCIAEECCGAEPGGESGTAADEEKDGRISDRGGNGKAVNVTMGSARKIVYTPPRPLTDLTEIPFLYEDLSQFENKIIYYESSRGCPFRCSYCLSSIDKQVRLRDMEVVKKELQFFLDHRVTQVKFVDRTFNCNKKHAMEIWQYLLDHDNGITNFHFEIAADILDEEELALLARFRPGAVQLEIGVQSTNEQTIREIDRRMDVALLRKIVQRIHDGRNIHIHLDLIAGLPYEDYDSFGRSFDDVYAMQPEQLQLGFLKVLKGSKMHEKSGEYGLVYGSRPPYEVLFTDWLSYDDVRRLKQIEEMVELYYNSNQFRVVLALVVPCFSSPFAFFEKLAAYYDRMGYFTTSPARSYRYQVLLAFLLSVRQMRSADMELYLEALTVDVYLRENAKSRPDFAPDASVYKEESRFFYQREAESHHVLPDCYASCDARTLARMTHLERISYDLHTGEKLTKPVFYLFDYENRSPLTHDAAVYVQENIYESFECGGIGSGDDRSKPQD